jgi:hypothetical protein
MNYQSFGWNLIQFSVLRSVSIWEGHVAWRYSPVPVWVDQWCEPLDLKGSGWSRSADTCSLKWTNRVHQIEIQRWENKMRRTLPFRVRFPARSSARRTRGWSPVSFWPPLVDGEAMMMISSSRGTRWWWRRARLFPEEGDEDGWRCTSSGVLWVLGIDIVLQWIGWGEVVRRKRRVRRGRLEGEGEAPAHRWRRIWPGIPADAAEAGEQFEQPGGTISSRKERGEGGVLGLL